MILNSIIVAIDYDFDAQMTELPHDLRTNKTFESIFFSPCGDISPKGQNPFT